MLSMQDGTNHEPTDRRPFWQNIFSGYTASGTPIISPSEVAQQPEVRSFSCYAVQNVENCGYSPVFYWSDMRTHMPVWDHLISLAGCVVEYMARCTHACSFLWDPESRFGDCERYVLVANVNSHKDRSITRSFRSQHFKNWATCPYWNPFCSTESHS